MPFEKANVNSNNNNKNFQKIIGHVERITYHNVETCFCVVKVQVNGYKKLVTITGQAVNINIGEQIEAYGIWNNNSKYGLQFKSEYLRTTIPLTLLGIEKYLGSGLIKGIGPHFAKKLISAFGPKIFDIIEKEPNKLTNVNGIGTKRKETILTSWIEQKHIQKILIFLQEHGIGAARATKIYKTYGNLAIDKIKENPYRLSQDIYGIGFKTADLLAKNLGIKNDSLIRIRAGIHYVLHEFTNHGHCATFLNDLILKSIEILEVSENIIKAALQKELEAQNVIYENNIKKGKIIYLLSLYKAEKFVAKNLIRLKNFELQSQKLTEIKITELINWVTNETKLIFSDLQKKAIKSVLNNKIIIITGGPGVGKTTIVHSIIKIAQLQNLKIALCAPTGRAAKRLSEITKLTVKTIHRLLKFEPKTFSFFYNYTNKLSTDFVIVDEVSMIDIILMNNLLQAIPNNARFLLVGDIDQLPSIGPGNVFHDIIKSKFIPIVKLTKIFRQTHNSNIVINAHRINEGKYPIIDNQKNQKNNNDSENMLPQQSTTPSHSKINKSDFYFIKCEDTNAIQTKLIDIVVNRIPKTFGFNVLNEIQILTPMHKGSLGTHTLNTIIQTKINRQINQGINKFGNIIALNDKIIQNTNNYDKNVFNGDIGQITKIDLENSQVHINFYENVIKYDLDELDEISLAYAISIHKSQGSEYPVIVMPITTQHYVMLTKNLIYTAITRAKKLVVLIGQPKALFLAIKNNNSIPRITNLTEKILSFQTSR